ncbi:M15 family metallopeptidase [Parahalioglobus pacificus]|uniref:Peptidase M15 n=1 Tax=Parahalioglobus pacificus TaxID=930806 RepID=A0A918XLC5_9GAMM|nr:M15 family metallopeptidase [Halioglobus pacificus]GHD37406.1 peptidase M15 [Halioglobus pacificus]
MLDSSRIEYLTGRDERQLVTLANGQRLHRDVIAPLSQLQRAAADAGFDLQVVSGFRSFERQRAIVNAKASGERAVHDDAGSVVDLDVMTPLQRLHAILRFSALPGASRHHWGTDLDVYDAAAVPDDYAVQLVPEEVAADGVFGPLHAWLDSRMARDASFGFYRPYQSDRGGVAVERWHLSYAPLARQCEHELTPEVVVSVWSQALGDEDEAWRVLAEDSLDQLFERYVTVPEDWCPGPV